MLTQGKQKLSQLVTCKYQLLIVMSEQWRADESIYSVLLCRSMYVHVRTFKLSKPHIYNNHVDAVDSVFLVHLLVLCICVCVCVFV